MAADGLPGERCTNRVSLCTKNLCIVEAMTTIGPRQGVLCLAGIAAMLSAACGSGTGGESSGSTSSAASTPSQPAAQVPPSPSAQGIPIRITFGSTTLTGRLNDTSTARALADQLPLTLPFRDVMNQEKIAALPRALPLTGVPEGDSADPGDIGYWVPDKSLVLYYRDVGFYNGIVRIGSFDGGREILKQQSDRFQVTLERAD
jgi:hypothetical protein